MVSWGLRSFPVLLEFFTFHIDPLVLSPKVVIFSHLTLADLYHFQSGQIVLYQVEAQYVLDTHAWYKLCITSIPQTRYDHIRSPLAIYQNRRFSKSVQA